MTKWDVVLGNGTTQRVVGERYIIATKMYGGNITFFRGSVAVAVYKDWLGFTVVESTEQASPVTQSGVIG